MRFMSISKKKTKAKDRQPESEIRLYLKDIAEHLRENRAVVGGNPAKFIKKRVLKEAE